MGFPRQEYWSGLPFPSPGDLLDPGFGPWSPVLQADSLPSEPPGKPQASFQLYRNLAAMVVMKTPHLPWPWHQASHAVPGQWSRTVGVLIQAHSSKTVFHVYSFTLLAGSFGWKAPHRPGRSLLALQSSQILPTSSPSFSLFLQWLIYLYSFLPFIQVWHVPQ